MQDELPEAGDQMEVLLHVGRQHHLDHHFAHPRQQLSLMRGAIEEVAMVQVYGPAGVAFRDNHIANFRGHVSCEQSKSSLWHGEQQPLVARESCLSFSGDECPRKFAIQGQILRKFPEQFLWKLAMAQCHSA